MAGEERAVKRQKNTHNMSTPPQTPAVIKAPPSTIKEVYADGDAILVVQDIGLRVSSHVLSIASPVFKQLVNQALPPHASSDPKLVPLPDEDTQDLTTIWMLCNVLHLQHDRLPPHLTPTQLLQYIRAASRYRCAAATSRVTSQWFDHIYHNVKDAPLFIMVDAARYIGDAMYFARFASRWVLQEPLGQRAGDIIARPDRQMLASALIARQKEAIQALKVDLDLLADCCAEALADDNKHYPDRAPGDGPPPGPPASGWCLVDHYAATDYLAALRDADIWPATRWPNSIEAIIKKIADFHIPEIDTDELCDWCIRVQDKFASTLHLVRQMERERFWGLCLDCFKAGGLHQGDCRYQHVKMDSLRALAAAREAGMEGQNATQGHAGAPSQPQLPHTTATQVQTPITASFPSAGFGSFTDISRDAAD